MLKQLQIARQLSGRTFGWLLAATIVGLPTPQPLRSFSDDAAENLVLPATLTRITEPWQTVPQPTPENARENESRRSGGVDVAPEGWRLTKHGWERAEQWPTSLAATNAANINTLINQQELAESSMFAGPIVERTMRLVQALNPVTLMAIEVTLLALLVASVFHRDSKRQHSRDVISR